MIEEAIKEIITAETEAEHIISEAHNKATEISLKTEELVNTRIAERAELLKKNLSEIAKRAEAESSSRRDEILAETKKNADSIYSDAQKAFSVAADYIVKFIVGD